MRRKWTQTESEKGHEDGQACQFVVVSHPVYSQPQTVFVFLIQRRVRGLVA